MANTPGSAGNGAAAVAPAARVRPNWSGFSPALGVIATVLVAAIMIASRQFGAIGLFTGMGVLQAVLAVAGAPMRVRPWAAFWFAAVGVAMTALAGAVARQHVSEVGALVVVAFLAACGMAVGPIVARMTNVMAVWFLVAVSLLSGTTEHVRPAVGFLIGSSAVFVLLEAWKRAKGIRVEAQGPGWTAIRERLAWGSPILTFALVYAIAGAAALELGWRLVPENRAWPAMAALVLIRPVARESIAMTAQRLGGTMLGSWLAVAIIGRIGDPRLLILMALAATFMLAATLRVDYMIFAIFLTAQVVAIAALGGKDPLQTGNDRVLGTLIGAVVAVAATIVLRWLAGLARQGATSAAGGARAS